MNLICEIQIFQEWIELDTHDSETSPYYKFAVVAYYIHTIGYSYLPIQRYPTLLPHVYTALALALNAKVKSC